MKIRFKYWYIEIETRRYFAFLKKRHAKKNIDVTVVGAAYYPFLLLDPDYSSGEDEMQKIHRAAIVNHEKIHLMQQLELLVIFEWLVRLYFTFYYIKIKKFPGVYFEQPFEQEAHIHMYEVDYLKHRRLFSTFKYIWKKDTPVTKIIVTKNDNVKVIDNELVKGVPTFKIAFE